MAKLLSGRVPKLNIGISSYSENQTTLSVVGISSFSNIVLNGSVSAGGTTGTSGQYLKSVGTGVTWASFPTLRTGNVFTAGAAQTSFTVSYNVGFVDVYINGVRLTDSEFTGTSGTSIVLNESCFGGETVDILAYNTTSTGSGGGGISTESQTLNDVLGLGNTSSLGMSVGVITATSFVGNLTGTATFATTSGIATYASNAGIATFATNTGIATFATSSGIATFATNAGIATFATNAGIATFATNAGIATFATNAGIATFATSSGIATFATTAGIATYATNAGIATFATTAGIATNAQGLSGTPNISVGVITATSYNGSGSNLTGIVTYISAGSGISVNQNSGNVTITAVGSSEGSWTVSAGSGTYSFTVPVNANYVMWVRGNIPNGICIWNATVSISNANVPVIGNQYGWYYVAGNQLVLTAIPSQIIGTSGSIITSSPAVSNTNTFSFGITNNSGTNQTVFYGYKTI
jgi:hypothetical protein